MQDYSEDLRNKSKESEGEALQKMEENIKKLNKYPYLDFQQQLEKLEKIHVLEQHDLGRIVGGMCPFSQNTTTIDKNYKSEVQDIFDLIEKFANKNNIERKNFLANFAFPPQKISDSATNETKIFPPHGINWYVFHS